MADDPIPAPVYVRYLGPGDAYLLRYTVGPYRVQAEVNRGDIAAVPTFLVPLLVDADQGSWEQVDPDGALIEIVEQDRRLAAREAEWRAYQRSIQAQKAQDEALADLNGAKVQAVRAAATKARKAGLPHHEVIAAAASAEVEFEQAIAEMAEG